MEMGTLKSRSGKCSTIWQVGLGWSAFSEIRYSESSDWSVGTETISLIIYCESVIEEYISNCCFNIAFDYSQLL